MSILNKVKKLSASLLAFEKHPARQLDLEQKFHYLNGLALVMLADEKIEESEKEYLKTLLTSLGISEEHLDNLIEFAQNPSDEALKDMLEAIEEMKELKYVFLLDALVLANYDGNLDEEEKGLIEEFTKLLKIKKDVIEKLEYLEKIIREKNKLALYRFFLGKYPFDVEIFNYLLDFFKIKKEEMLKEYIADVKKKITFNYEPFVIVSSSDRTRRNRNEYWLGNYKEKENSYELKLNLSNSPITITSYLYFLQFLLDQNEVEIFEGNKLVNSKGEFLLDLDNNGISIKNGTYVSEAIDYVKVTIAGARSFIQWYSNLIGEKVDFPTIPLSKKERTFYSSFVLDKFDLAKMIKEIKPNFEKNEVFLVKENNEKNYFVKYPKFTKVKSNYSNLIFRVQKIEGNQELNNGK